MGSIRLIMTSALGAPAQDPRRLRRQAEKGELVRIRPGVYAERQAWNNAFLRDRHLASVLAVTATRRSRPAVFCRETALSLHGVALWDVPRLISFRTSRPNEAGMRQPKSPPGIKYRHLGEQRLLRPSAWDLATGGVDTEELLLAGLRTRVEPLGRVLADTIPRMAPVEATVVLDALLGGRPAGVKKRNGRPSRRWTKVELEKFSEWCTSAAARARFLACLDFATELTESPGESASRVVIRDLGFAVPELQHRVYDRHGDLIGITDFWWKDIRTVAEFDGLAKYLGRKSYSGLSAHEVIAQERRREDAIGRQGLKMVRWLFDDVRNPSRLGSKLHWAGVPQART